MCHRRLNWLVIAVYGSALLIDALVVGCAVHRLRAPACESSRCSSAATAARAHSSSVIRFLSETSLRQQAGAFGLAPEGISAPVGASQKGEQVLGIHAFTFVLSQPVLQPVQPSSFLKGPALEFTHLQREFPLLTRIDGPPIVPYHVLQHAKSYRQAVRLALWIARRERPALKPVDIAREVGITRQHCTDYFIECDKPTRRSLPAERVAAVEKCLKNSAISQWLARNAKFTVLEELQAGRVAA